MPPPVLYKHPPPETPLPPLRTIQYSPRDDLRISRHEGETGDIRPAKTKGTIIGKLGPKALEKITKFLSGNAGGKFKMPVVEKADSHHEEEKDVPLTPKSARSGVDVPISRAIRSASQMFRNNFNDADKLKRELEAVRFSPLMMAPEFKIPKHTDPKPFVPAAVATFVDSKPKDFQYVRDRVHGELSSVYSFQKELSNLDAEAEADDGDVEDTQTTDDAQIPSEQIEISGDSDDQDMTLTIDDETDMPPSKKISTNMINFKLESVSSQPPSVHVRRKNVLHHGLGSSMENLHEASRSRSSSISINPRSRSGSIDSTLNKQAALPSVEMVSPPPIMFSPAPASPGLHRYEFDETGNSQDIQNADDFFDTLHNLPPTVPVTKLTSESTRAYNQPHEEHSTPDSVHVSDISSITTAPSAKVRTEYVSSSSMSGSSPMEFRRKRGHGHKPGEVSVKRQHRQRKEKITKSLFGPFK